MWTLIRLVMVSSGDISTTIEGEVFHREDQCLARRQEILDKTEGNQRYLVEAFCQKETGDE